MTTPAGALKPGAGDQATTAQREAGRHLPALRVTAGYSQRQLARRVGYSHSTLAHAHA
jgi:Helix-turn-helix domain